MMSTAGVSVKRRELSWLLRATLLVSRCAIRVVSFVHGFLLVYWIVMARGFEASRLPIWTARQPFE
jgi:hypothetical protein